MTIQPDDRAYDALAEFPPESASSVTDEIRPHVSGVEWEPSPCPPPVRTDLAHDAPFKAPRRRESSTRMPTRLRVASSIALSIWSFGLGVVAATVWLRPGSLPSWTVPVTALPAYLGRFVPRRSHMPTSTVLLPSAPLPAPMSLATAVPSERRGAFEMEFVGAGPDRSANERPPIARRPVSPGGDSSNASPATAPLTVAGAQLCRNLPTSIARGISGQWQCDRPGLPVHTGSLFFYTRIRSARDALVQHRWYCGDQLRKVVDLHIRANPSVGYRTYSRHSIGPESQGDWRVELRTSDGILLQEERFTVR